MSLSPATPHPQGQLVTLCRPTTGVGQGDSRTRVIPELSLSSPFREKKHYSGPRSLFESLPQPTRHSLGALWCVSHRTPDSDCPWHTRAQSAYTHLSLRLMSELFAGRHSRSAWETGTPTRATCSVKNLSLHTHSSPPLGGTAPLGVLLEGAR